LIQLGQDKVEFSCGSRSRKVRLLGEARITFAPPRLTRFQPGSLSEFDSTFTSPALSEGRIYFAPGHAFKSDSTGTSWMKFELSSSMELR
jgi:hypothetical protein